MLINQAQVKSENVTNEQELFAIENDYYADLAQALVRLEQNEDFKKVIMNGYFKDKAIKGVEIIASPHVRANGLRGEVIEELNSISMLNDYFMTIKSLGLAPVEDDEDVIEE